MPNNNANKVVNALKNRKVILSTLWIFAVLNYIYADVFSLYFTPGIQKESLEMASGMVLVFAFLMETSIAMVVLSRVTKYGLNRWLNIIFAIVHTALVGWSLSDGKPASYYIMFCTIEIICTLFILVYAWRWPRQEA
jgi:hypothetical protein